MLDSVSTLDSHVVLLWLVVRQLAEDNYLSSTLQDVKQVFINDSYSD